jgi:cytochrome P450 family 12
MIRAVKTRGVIALKKQFNTLAKVSADPKVAQNGVTRKFEEMPTLSKFELIRRFMPGGKFHQISILEVQKMLQEELGTIYRLPGMFGQTTTVTTFDAEDIEYVHRNEGVYPFRRGLETLKYFREKIRPDMFDIGGLITE